MSLRFMTNLDNISTDGKLFNDNILLTINVDINAKKKINNVKNLAGRKFVKSSNRSHLVTITELLF